MATCHLILPHRIERQAYAPTRFVSFSFLHLLLFERCVDFRCCVGTAQTPAGQHRAHILSKWRVGQQGSILFVENMKNMKNQENHLVFKGFTLGGPGVALGAQR